MVPNKYGKMFIEAVRDSLKLIKGNERRAYNLADDGDSEETYVFFSSDDNQTIIEELTKAGSLLSPQRDDAKYKIEYYRLQYLELTYCLLAHGLADGDFNYLIDLFN